MHPSIHPPASVRSNKVTASLTAFDWATLPTVPSLGWRCTLVRVPRPVAAAHRIVAANDQHARDCIVSVRIVRV